MGKEFKTLSFRILLETQYEHKYYITILTLVKILNDNIVSNMCVAFS